MTKPPAVALAPRHIFDGGVDAFHRSRLPGDQTDSLRTIPLGLIGCVPGPPDGGVPVDIAVQGAEDQVAAGEDVLQMLRQSGVFPGCLGGPRAEESGDRPGGGGGYTRRSCRDLLASKHSRVRWGLPLLSIPSR